MQSPWRNLKGPARLLAMCATILLIASAMLGIEAGIMIILGPARSIVIKPFILLGYLEICAIFFTFLGIIGAIIGLVFAAPYRYLSMKFFVYRAKRSGEVSDEHTYFEDVPKSTFTTPKKTAHPTNAPIRSVWIFCELKFLVEAYPDARLYRISMIVSVVSIAAIVLRLSAGRSPCLR